MPYAPIAPMAPPGLDVSGSGAAERAELGDLFENPAADPFGAMSLKRMRDFMAHHGRQACFRLSCISEFR